MAEHFLVELYEKEQGGEVKFNGLTFDSVHLGREVPCHGDSIISPLRKADFKSSRDPAKHAAFEVVHRYFLPDITKDEGPIIVKLLVRRRALTDAERALFETQ